MERVTGIGGLFFRSRDPAALGRWYRDQLGINLVPDGSGGEPWHQQAGTTAFAPFAHDTDYFGDPSRQWMVNFRVRNLDAMVAQLRAGGTTVSFDPAPSPYGRFARLADPEGNPIELWEESAE